MSCIAMGKPEFQGVANLSTVVRTVINSGSSDADRETLRKTCRSLAAAYVSSRNDDWACVRVEGIQHLSSVSAESLLAQNGNATRLARHFDGYDLFSMSDVEILIRLRKIMAVEVNRTLGELIDENDPPLAGILEHLFLPASATHFIDQERFGGPYVVPLRVDTLSFLPILSNGELSDLVRSLPHSGDIDELVGRICARVGVQTARSRMMRMMPLACAVRDAPVA